MSTRRVKRPSPGWLRLDNAAKIYPAARSRTWMALFRVSITLTEPIDEALLQKALRQLVKRVPLLSYRLKRGLFWYYFDWHEAIPAVQPDARNPMLPINLRENGGFLFRVRSFDKRIALEVFHALTDGTGGMTFLLTLTAEYLRLKYGQRIPEAPMILDMRDEPQREEWEDAFLRYARDAYRPRQEETAWHLKGVREKPGYLNIITGHIPTQELLNLAREKGCSVNSLLAALLLNALIQAKNRRRKPGRKPVKLSLPVNLRRYYETRTLRNFSSYINVPVYTDYGNYSLDDLISLVSHTMGLETLEPLVNARFSANVKAERNWLLRVFPLFMKTAVLKFMYHATGESYMTSTLSNMGLVKLPPEMEQHCQRVELMLGAPKRTPLSCAVVSACGNTAVNFTKTIRDSQVERVFFTQLVELGVPVLIESNWRE
ncbi:MAG: hypothetical protein ACOX6O_08345 [Christensenellales bacterium]